MSAPRGTIHYTAHGTGPRPPAAIEIVLEMPTGIPARFFKTITALP